MLALVSRKRAKVVSRTQGERPLSLLAGLWQVLASLTRQMVDMIGSSAISSGSKSFLCASGGFQLHFISGSTILSLI